MLREQPGDRRLRLNFANVSIPSLTMIGYAGFYGLVALAIAVYHFHERDL